MHEGTWTLRPCPRRDVTALARARDGRSVIVAVSGETPPTAITSSKVAGKLWW